jgi:proteasome accessory factor B
VVHKLERLLNLLALLLDTGHPLSAEEIREQIPGYSDDPVAFRRTFERDKAELRDMGVPVSVERIPGTEPPQDGYRVDRRASAGQDPQLEPDELAALYLAANMVRVGDLPGSDPFWKLGGSPTAPGGGAEDEDVVGIPGDPNLPPLFDATAAGRRVRFRYRDESRAVSPHQLAFSRGHWYLWGYDHLRAGVRSYRIDRIDGVVEVLAEPADRPAPGTRHRPLPGWELGDAEPVAALLLVDADQTPWAAHQLGEAAVVERRPDGSAVFRLTVSNPEGFRSFVLTFLDHAEVLAPPELRADVVAWLTRLAGGRS